MIPDGATVDPLAREIRKDGKVIEILPACRYRAHMNRISPREVRGSMSEERSGEISPRTYYNNPPTNPVYQAWSVADASGALCVGGFGVCKPWFNQMFSRILSVPPKPTNLYHYSDTTGATCEPSTGICFGSGEDMELWNAIVPDQAQTIVQPVLAFSIPVQQVGHSVSSASSTNTYFPYGATPQWFLASWFVGQGVGYYSAPIQVNPGDTVWLRVEVDPNAPGPSCDMNTGFNCNWAIYSTDATWGGTTLLQMAAIPNYGTSSNRMSGGYRGTLEAQRQRLDCNEFPSVGARFDMTYAYQPYSSPTNYNQVNQAWFEDQVTQVPYAPNYETAVCGFSAQSTSQTSLTIHFNSGD